MKSYIKTNKLNKKSKLVVGYSGSVYLVLDHFDFCAKGLLLHGEGRMQGREGDFFDLSPAELARFFVGELVLSN